jgi:polar amino acid transport system substrate-binding protein
MRDEVPYLLEEMQEGANRIKRIVEELKDFARLDTSAAVEPVNVNAVVKAAVRLVDSSLRSSTKCFEASYAPSLPTILGNAQRIEQVVINLILNACQALPDTEHGISLRTSHDEVAGAVVLTVTDEGSGIAPENLSHLTDPFFTTRRESGGTGLGLSVSATIIKEHNGSLEFASTPGGGTTVTLTLPVAARS